MAYSYLTYLKTQRGSAMTNKAKYKNLKAGTEFIFMGRVFIKNDWISAQVKGKKLFLSIQPSAQVEVITA